MRSADPSEKINVPVSAPSVSPLTSRRNSSDFESLSPLLLRWSRTVASLKKAMHWRHCALGLV
jgi:hypothetical protein